MFLAVFLKIPIHLKILKVVFTTRQKLSQLNTYHQGVFTSLSGTLCRKNKTFKIFLTILVS